MELHAYYCRNYTCRTHFPEQQNNAQHTGAAGGAGAYYSEGYSANTTLIVTEEPQPHYPWFQPPTEYWTRPIDSQIREWGRYAGPSYNTEFQDAPEGPHVLWAQRLTNEGVIGGTVDNRTNYQSRIILAGVLIYNQDPIRNTFTNFNVSNAANVSEYYLPTKTIAVDVRTGVELWEMNITQNSTGLISFGQLYYHPSINRNAVYAYAWAINETSG